MMRSLSALILCLVVLVLIAATSACTRQAVVVTADPDLMDGMDGCFAFLGAPVESGGPILERLCSKDIDEIIDLSGMEGEKGRKLKDMICGPDSSPERFKTFFRSLSLKERQRLIRSFEIFGYDINAYGC